MEDVMRKQFLIPVLVGILALGAAPAFAQSATVVMRNGDRVQAQLLDMGREIVIGVNGQTRRVPIGEVVLIDFAGNGRDVSSEELSRANAANGYVVMRNGETFNASLQDLTGKPLIAVFSNGRRANLGEVSRIYLNSVANVAGFPNQPSGGQTSTSGDGGSSNAPSNARTVVVPANVAWSNTGINVTRGQNLRFDATGEIRLSFNGDDVARPMGAVSGRLADKAPLPNVPAGALIGRINNGPPFSIGTNAVPIPENGRLLLGVNDDHVADNSGNFTVRIWEP
jgi:sorbitol-specific phosphotransferase system component IIA